MGYDNLGHNLISVIKETNKTKFGGWGGGQIQFGCRGNKRLNVRVLFFMGPGGGGLNDDQTSHKQVPSVSTDRSLDQQRKRAMEEEETR